MLFFFFIGNGIEKSAAGVLAEALKTNSSLTMLDLAGNYSL
jgi:hypothetical protein